jgi:hypothetical protein
MTPTDSLRLSLTTAVKIGSFSSSVQVGSSLSRGHAETSSARRLE